MKYEIWIFRTSRKEITINMTEKYHPKDIKLKNTYKYYVLLTSILGKDPVKNCKKPEKTENQIIIIIIIIICTNLENEISRNFKYFQI